MVFANSSPGDCVHLGKRHNSSTTPMKARTKDRLRRFGKLKIRLREFDVKPPISQQPITNAPSFPLSRLNALTQVLLLSRDQPAAQCPNSPAGYSRGLTPFQSYPAHPVPGRHTRAFLS